MPRATVDEHAGPEVGIPPAAVGERLRAVDAALDEVLPVKQLDRNLLVGTWNLRAFAGLTKNWRTGRDDSPKRNFADLAAIARIVSRFDVCAVQEVRGDLRALRYLLKALGPDWGVIMTDVCKTKGGNDERLAFLFDSRRVKPSGLAGEFAEPFDRETGEISQQEFSRQFARTPYAVSFYSAGQTFILVTLHAIYGKGTEDRLAELRAIARRLADFADEVANWGHNLIALGDFNIDRAGDPLFDAFTSTGLSAPPGLDAVPRTIFDEPQDAHFYDQIAWFEGSRGPLLHLSCNGAGGFDFVPLLREDHSLEDLSWKISDHYPLWVEFSVRPTP
jgi:endonuclease/exonuclease/phosphatase family metal-dependent hydrolase